MQEAAMVLYVTESGTQLHRSGEQIVVRRGTEELATVHLHELEQVALFGRIGMTPDTIGVLLQRGIDTVMFTSDGQYRGRLVGRVQGNAALRQAQLRRHDDPHFRLTVARSLATGKLRNMRTLVLRLGRRRGRAVLEQTARLRRALGAVPAAPDLEALRGLEGAGTAAYFDAMRLFLPPELGFQGRNRRPPRDPANALLSFAYALLASQVEGAVYLTGMDPFVGFLHAVECNRPSLVFDLMEEFRSVLADAVVLDLANHGRVLAEHWQRRDGGCYLSDGGRRLLIAAFRARMETRVAYPVGGDRTEQLTYRECLVRQARLLGRVIMGEAATYDSFAVK